MAVQMDRVVPDRIVHQIEHIAAILAQDERGSNGRRPRSAATKRASEL
jgi:hypothetical protein